MFCGKCGANIPDGYEFCMKCGTKIDMNQDNTEIEHTINDNDKEIRKKKIHKKGILLSLGILIAVLLAGAGVAYTKIASVRNGYFANIAWATDIDTVKEKVDKAYNCDSIISDDRDCVMAEIEDYKEMKGVTALTGLYCKDKECLNEVTVVFLIDDDSDYTESDVVEKVTKEYNKLYGECDKNEKLDFHSYTWKTKNSYIELSRIEELMVLLQFKQLDDTNSD